MSAEETSRHELERSLTKVFSAHADGLRGAVRAVLGRGCEPAEVVQDASVRAWTALLGGERPRDLAAWVFVITINCARDRRRRQRRTPKLAPLHDVDAMELQTERERPTTGMEAAEAVDAARAAIERLAEPEKDVFLLRVSGELTFAAAADALGIPIGTAKTRMRSALQRLRQELRPFAPSAPDATPGTSPHRSES